MKKRRRKVAPYSSRRAAEVRARLKIIERWRDEKLGPTFDAIIRRCEELELAMTEGGEIYFPVTGETVSQTHFKSIMRHEMAEFMEGLPCKDRELIFESILEAFAKTTKMIMDSGIELENHRASFEELARYVRPDKDTITSDKQSDIHGLGVLQHRRTHSLAGLFCNSNPRWGGLGGECSAGTDVDTPNPSR